MQSLGDVDCFTASRGSTYGGGARASYPGSGNYNFVTTSGMALSIYTTGQNCSNNWTAGKTQNMSKVCGVIYVDINGPNKLPNNLGRDVFHFWLTNGKGPLLYPFGGIDDNSGYFQYWKTGNSCSALTTGYTCAARIIEEDWVMNY